MKFTKNGIITIVTVCVAYFLLYQAVSYIPASVPAEKFSPVCIIIDAGHGGEDGGTSTFDGIKESSINLSVALHLEQLSAFCGLSPVMIRTEDVSLHTEGDTIREHKISDLKNRVAKINAAENAILLSVHQNHFPESKYAGAQVFYAGTAGSKQLAATLQNTFYNVLETSRAREAKRSQSVYLMEQINCTGVLVECGFLSNPVEAQLLQKKEYQKKLAFAIVYGVTQYLEEGNYFEV